MEILIIYFNTRFFVLKFENNAFIFQTKTICFALYLRSATFSSKTQATLFLFLLELVNEIQGIESTPIQRQLLKFVLEISCLRHSK